MQITESFHVDAPPERVWRWLLDPARVVTCLPGAELLGEEADDTYRGRVRIKVGPVTASYEGTARFVETDHEAYSVRMRCEGREAGGAGSATADITSTVTARDGGAEVQVRTEFDVVGRIVQYGRGMIQEVSRQLFRQFAGCLQDRLQDDDGGAGGAVSPAGTGSGAADDAMGANTAPAGGSDERDPGAESAGTAGTAEGGAPPTQESLDILPLLWRSLRSMIGRLFGRS